MAANASIARTASPHARAAAAQRSPPADTCAPYDRYQELFVAVQEGNVFPDSKTFVDCAPRSEPERILDAYRLQRLQPGFDLAGFVHRHFELPRPARSDYHPLAGQNLAAHIDTLWPHLTRQPDWHPHRGSLLPLPHAYVVPGGRFVELYYWDSYFTMLGLAESGLADLVHQMTDDFAYLIDTYGHVPNGTRTYYLSRSQPPVFALMIQLCEARGGQAAAEYLPQLRREHAFWMDGERALAPGSAHRRVVALPDGTRLNRYWDDRALPREESWREDVATAAQSALPRDQVYLHLRAAAESGWDFSSRWLAEGDAGLPSTALPTICTTDLLPVDLNCFLHELEATIARLAHSAGQAATAREFVQRAHERARAIARCFWRADGGYFVDYDWRQRRQRRCITAAAMVPLFCGVASQAQAEATAMAVCNRLLAPGGLGTTECASGQQWDRPNGFAPLHWMAVEGLRRYGLHAPANEIRNRWLKSVRTVYEREGRLVEKYAMRPDVPHQHVTGGGGGEYPLQDGFGWTNGVTRRWLHEEAAR